MIHSSLNRPISYPGALAGRGPVFGDAFAITTPNSLGLCGMDWPDYLRDQSAVGAKEPFKVSDEE